MDEDAIARRVVHAAMEIHSTLGPGLLENVYVACMERELSSQHLAIQKELIMPARYKGLVLDVAYRLDLVVAGKVVLEFKSVESLLPLHRAQLLSYLRLGGYTLGLLLNFNTLHMRDGIKRVVNGL
jgi:GxxExxY protein